MDDNPLKEYFRYWIKASVLIFLIATLSLDHSTRGAEIKSLPEYQLKALYLYNFAKDVEWPKDAFSGPGTPITIGILGNNPFGSDLATMVRNRTANGRKILVKRVIEMKELRTCHILFIAAAEEKRWPEVLSTIKDLSILTVGETPQFTRTGGVIALAPEGRRVGIEINMEAAEQARLVVSSHVLRVIKVIPARPSPRNK